MGTFLEIFIVTLLVLAFIGWLADRRAAAEEPNVTPGLSFLPGDIKYESRNGNVRVYFPGRRRGHRMKRRDVCLWHLADMPRILGVRFRG